MNLNSLLGFAEVVSAILGAMGLAMALEWLTLSGLLRLMPSRSARTQASHTRPSL